MNQFMIHFSFCRLALSSKFLPLSYLTRPHQRCALYARKPAVEGVQRPRARALGAARIIRSEKSALDCR